VTRRAPSRWFMQGPITLLLALAPATAMSQVPVASGSEALGRIAGTAWDSLRMRPVAGAAVWSATSGRAAVADTAGRFVLDSIASGDHELLVSDPWLDSLGLAIMQVVRVDPAADDPQPVILATPSLRTFAARMCATGDEPPDGHGILFGVVRSGVTGKLLSGALVSASWLRVETTSGGERAIPDVVALQPLTDSLGRYAACGVPIDTTVQLTAFTGERETPTLHVDVGMHRLVRRDLLIGADTAAGAPTGVVRGLVTDSTGRPLKGIEVLVDNTTLATRTGDDGRFSVQGVPVGTQLVIVRRPGYAPVYTDAPVMAQRTAQLHIVLRTVRLLSAVEIRADKTSRRIQELERRRDLGFGHHFDADALRRAGAYSALFYQVPGVRVERGRFLGDFHVVGRERSMRGDRCVLTLFVDGVPHSMEELHLYRVDDLLAFEVHPSATTLPPEISMRTNGCGALLLWTRSM